MPRSWKKLTQSLESSGKDVVEMSFDEVNTLVGELPLDKMQDPEWWANDPGKPRGKSWLNAGFRVDDVDVSQKKVRFTRA